MARVILAAVGFIILMSIGAMAISTQGDFLGHNYDIDAETVDASGSSFAAGETVELTNSNLSDATYGPGSQINVRDDTGVEMVEGVDYNWNPEGNGTIVITSNSDLLDSANLEVDYQFDIPTDQQQEILTIVGAQVGIGQYMMYAFGAVIAVVFIRLLGSVG